MDEHVEVKKKRAWWVKSALWAAGILVFLGVSVLVTATAYDAHARRVARELAALPVRERNLAIFDAACEVLKSHYYHPEVFETDAWRAYEKGWRAQAAKSGPGALLYMNVLNNFGARFLDSHVGFEAPQAAAAAEGPAKPVAAAVTQSAERTNFSPRVTMPASMTRQAYCATGESTQRAGISNVSEPP